MVVTPPAGAPAAPPFAPTQEIRFAVVLYGGVALAIYINGVVQELLHLVRATAPAEPTEGAPHEAAASEAQLVGTERVYRKLGQMLRWAGRPSASQPAPGDPIQTRFIVDIISGSSAGGINGVFLAKALANEQPIGQLKQLWIDEGDVGLLVNDRKSYDGLELTPQRSPRSLLNSRRFYWRMLAALDGMEEQQAVDRSRLVDELDLWITTTDVRGLMLPVDLYDRVVYERRHKNVFHFRYGSEYARGVRAHDFTRDDNPFLAFAARCTSAFPFALEPMLLDDIDEVVRTNTFRPYQSGNAASSRWRRFFDDYVRARRGGEDQAGGDDRFYRREAFSDGGILDNKPFTHATQMISRRRADLPVDRRLLYIEPDPGGPQAVRRRPESRSALEPPKWMVPDEPPNALDTVRAALLNLPRTEPIREDLLALVARNREIARVRDIVALVDMTANEHPELAIEPTRREDWRRETVEAMLRDPRRGLQYLAYHRLKIAITLDDLAELFTNLSGFSGDSDEYSGARCLVQAWFDSHFPETEPGPGQWTHNEFLFRYDARYRMRRLNFLDARIEELLRFDERAAGVWERFGVGEVDELRPAIEATLRAVKAELSDVFIELRSEVRRLRGRGPDNPLLEPLSRLGFTREELLVLLDGARTKDESVARAREHINDRGLDEPLTELAETLWTVLQQIFRPARQRTDRILDLGQPEAATPEDPARRAALLPLQHFFRAYESYDAVVLPVSYRVVDEADRVEVIRISPQDAPSLIDETSPNELRRKLAGGSMSHFGGFFERVWRKNDILWGRLDAAERIIDTLLLQGDVPDDVRAELLREAQVAIIEEEFSTSDREPLASLIAQNLLVADRGAETASTLVGGSDPNRIRDAVAATLDPERIRQHLATSYEVDRVIDRERLLDTVGRSTQVTGRLLDGITDQPSVRRAARWLTRVGRLLWLLVETATPRTPLQLLYRYWLALLVLMSLVMIVGGALFGAPATSKAGWVVLSLAFAWRLAVWLTEDVLHRRGRWPLLVALAFVAGTLTLAVTEVALHLDEDVAALVDKLPERVERFLRWIWPWD